MQIPWDMRAGAQRTQHGPLGSTANAQRPRQNAALTRAGLPGPCLPGNTLTARVCHDRCAATAAQLLP